MKIYTLIALLLTLNLNATCIQADYKQYNKKGMVKGPPAVGGIPAQGTEYLHIKDISDIFEKNQQNQYAFIDTRPFDMYSECTIKGAYNIPFKFSQNGNLKKSKLEEFIKQGKKIIFFCNSLQCYRSLNATIEARCNMNLPANKIFWFGRGTAGIASSPHAHAILQGKKCDTMRILIKGKETR